MNIAVFGVGYVGLVTAIGFSEAGHSVTAVDLDREKIEKLRQGISPIHERYVPELLQTASCTKLTFTDDVEVAMNSADAAFLCVGTPTGASGRADLSALFEAVKSMVPWIRKRILIVNKSTVPVGTSANLKTLLCASGVPETLFSVACNPEFLREGSAIRDFIQPDRIVIGADDSFARETLRTIYAPLLSGSVLLNLFGDGEVRPAVLEMSTRSAELLKYASNAFLALKISYINAIANIAEQTGADIDDIAQGMGEDPRIGSQFLQAGIGYGGSCFPKDIQELRRISESVGECFDLLGEVQRINTMQRIRLVDKLETQVGPIKGKQLAVLGISFKAGTGDLRCSPAMAVIELLLSKGARIRAYDPAAMDEARIHLGRSVSFGTNVYDAIRGADAALILTDWPQFASLDLPKIRRLLARPVFVDGRNLYRPEEMAAAGLIYVSIGRPPIAPINSKSEQLVLDTFSSSTYPEAVSPGSPWQVVEPSLQRSLQTSHKSDIEV